LQTAVLHGITLLRCQLAASDTPASTFESYQRAPRAASRLNCPNNSMHRVLVPRGDTFFFFLRMNRHTLTTSTTGNKGGPQNLWSRIGSPKYWFTIAVLSSLFVQTLDAQPRSTAHIATTGHVRVRERTSDSTRTQAHASTPLE
jgi:hypothetical protein